MPLNLKNHKNLIKITNLFVYLLILISCCIITYYIAISQINECTQSPFTYGANQMEKNTGYEFYGVGYFLTPINIESPTITFNSSHLSWDYLNSKKEQGINKNKNFSLFN